jgi:ABC-type polysaccharide/polyol phosphate export permease
VKRRRSTHVSEDITRSSNETAKLSASSFNGVYRGSELGITWLFQSPYVFPGKGDITLRDFNLLSNER